MKITFAIILICLGVFIAQLIVPAFTDVFGLTPNRATRGQFWQFVTYMFLHSTYTLNAYGGLSVNIWHLGINMFVLLIFGVALEEAIGKRKFIKLYLISGVGSAIIYMLLTGASTITMIGASGAVFGVLAGYAILFPKRWVFIFGLFPMPAIVFIIIFGAWEVLSGLSGLQPGVANWGHVGGILFGAGLMLYWRHKAKKPKTEKSWSYVWEK